MAKKSAGENTKKAAGNAKKAEVAAQKQAVKDAERAKADDEYWSQGAKGNSKKQAVADKQADAARKKAERDAQLKAEEDSLPSKPKGGGKTAGQKQNQNRGLDLSQLDSGSKDPNSNKASTLNATGIDDALDALKLSSNSGANDKVERHPERRFKAAYTVFEERRLQEMADDKSLRRQQKQEIIRKEFEKSPENPFNQAMIGRFDMSKEEMSQLREDEWQKTEARLQQNS